MTALSKVTFIRRGVTYRTLHNKNPEYDLKVKTAIKTTLIEHSGVMGNWGDDYTACGPKFETLD